MVSKKILVTNELGIHARPASLLISAAKNYNCNFILAKNEHSTNLHSLTALMKLRIKQGDTITVSAEGPDEETGIAGLINMVETRFGEK